ncbi:MAG: heme lyase CcmF/NrfE family subunit [Acidimicrobiales bacterium]|nr:heme lyase CcmF/NrfE family subunit [Acidimicrobiales bacterium]
MSNQTLGVFAVATGFAASMAGVGVLVYGLAAKRREVVALVKPLSVAILGGGMLGFLVLERALFQRDYTLLYVANQGSPDTPPLFNFAALWSALEGSILLWAVILAGYLVIVVVKFRHRLVDPLVTWALLVLFIVTAFFYFLMLDAANPFAGFDPPPGYVGTGPNPLLQNHWLVTIHPPVLYLGYVGFTVPFSFAIAALVTGRIGEGWLVETRRWTLFAWGFLTVGILLGSWWSYEVLGWGGYWAWDPVENSALLPWLTGTAFLHSVMVQERRGMLRVWNLSLVCSTFALTILATFLTRSGVLDSVHAFSDSDIGPLLLGAFGVVAFATVGLIGWRGDRLRSVGRIDSPLSREGAFLANNVVFGAFAFVVLLGTVMPLIVEAVNGDRISIGNPYFDRMSAPIGFVLLFLMAMAPVLPWRKASGEILSKRLIVPAWIGVGSALLALLLGARGFQPILAFLLAGFAAGSALRQIVLASRRQGWRGLVGRANGGMIVHLGVIMIAVAYAASSAYIRQAEWTLNVGDQVVIGGHELEFTGLTEIDADGRTGIEANVLVDGEGPYSPAVSQYPGGNQTVGTPAIRSGFTEDIALSMITFDTNDETVVLRATTQPLIQWLWWGGAVMAVGTVLAAFPGRRRRPTDAVSAPVVATSRPDPAVTQPVGPQSIGAGERA